MSLVPTVLLVEDSEDDAFFFRRALDKGAIPCHFSHATDGGAAIKLLQAAHADSKNLPDFIFLDLKMPVKNGFEVLEWIRAQAFTHPMVVVVLSGSDQEADQTRSRALGAADYLVKPISSEMLSKWIQGNPSKDNPGLTPPK